MSSDRRKKTVVGDGSVGAGDTQTPGISKVTTTVETVMPSLSVIPNNEHIPDNYDDLQLEFNPSVFSILEKYLPPNILRLNRYEKAKTMSDIMLKYISREECLEVKSLHEYKQKIISNYQPLHKELYAVDPTFFFVPSFLKAINTNTEESLRSIISIPHPGVLVFEMLQPSFCKMMISEVRNFRMWVHETKFQCRNPTTINKNGIMLDDFGLDSMLDKFMEDFVHPISKVFFLDIGGSTLDSHHGFVVEYGQYRGVNSGIHVDDAEVTLNVCLGKEFVEGEINFRGIRCKKHMNTGARLEEIFDYCPKPGQAVIHNGRHCHDTIAPRSGMLVNMILWCKSSVFKEVSNYHSDYLGSCGKCVQEKKEKKELKLVARRKEFIRVENEAEV